MRRFLASVVVLGAVFLLGGCASSPPSEPLVVEASVGASARGDRARAAAAALSAEQIQRVLMLLDRAEQSMKARRYTSPLGNNAWEDYREVIALLPEHEEAITGLRKIADSYVDWGYAALREGQYESARSYLSRATMVMPDHPAIAGLKAAIPKRQPSVAKVRQPVVAAPPAQSAKPAPAAPEPAVAEPPVVAIPVEDSAQSQLAINRRELRRRSGDLKAQLAGFADLIEARNSRVTIEAPTDADGRWLYQRLNDRREEYRIRANFRISEQPRIRLLD
ncbi:hypothetical protein [Motiliproteus sediminis]|uniref:hypothetical protein n=1 Tax=Motiliproteus sediminis TaxID=1468178 RepID=UPI001AEFD7F7|nr:hypothetical protein [Motiliproteus sediminis]